MELRGCSHLHFISVIRSGEVMKVPNINRGMATLKFKDIEEVYGYNNSEYRDSLATNHPKVNRSLSMFYGCDEVMTKVKIESMEEENELNFGEMTLKQLQKTCKSKKRKALKYVNLTDVKQENNSLQCEEDEHELKETLGSWKRKLLKKTKAKKNCITECGSMSSETNNIGGGSKDMVSDLDSHEISMEICKPMRIKVEDPEPGYSQPQAISCILNDGRRNMQGEILGAVASLCLDQDPKKTLGDLQSGNLNQTSHEHLVHRMSISEETHNCSLNQVSYISEETHNCSLNQVSYEHLQNVQVRKDSKIVANAKVDDTAVTGDHPSVLPGSELRKEEDMSDLMTCEEAPETVFLEFGNSNFQDSFLHARIQVPPRLVNFSEVEPCMGLASKCQDVEFITHSQVSPSKDNDKDIEAEVITKTVENCSSTGTSNEYFLSHSDAVSCDDVTSVVKGKPSAVLDMTDASLTCPPDGQPCEAIDKISGSSARENYEDKKVSHPPERLFSARKTISPNTQERLCRAMNSSELQACREKLFSDNECKDRSSSTRADLKRGRIIFTSKRPEAIDKAIPTNPRVTIKKGKDERKGPHPKAIVKGPHTSHISQSAGSGFSSGQSCSENAISFSQQQMNDIERLSTMLMTELQSMKEVVVDVLHYETRMGAKLRCSIDEVRVAVENARKAEETTKRFLSMMTRDCNRFCKLMKLNEADATSPEKTVQKERKIMFADEAGKKLCDVRVFEAFGDGVSIASPLESQTTDEALGA